MKTGFNYQALGFWAKYPEQMDQIDDYFESQKWIEGTTIDQTLPKEIAELIEGHTEIARQIYDFALTEGNTLVMNISRHVQQIFTSNKIGKIRAKKNQGYWSSTVYINSMNPKSSLDQRLHIGFNVESTARSPTELEVYSWLWLKDDKYVTEQLQNLLREVGIESVHARQAAPHWDLGTVILKRTILTPNPDDFSLGEESIIREATTPFAHAGFNEVTIERILQLKS